MGTRGSGFIALTACVDSDALVNLLALDCFHDALGCLDLTERCCFRLPAVIAQIERAGWVGKRWPKADRRSMAEVARRLQTLPPPGDLKLLELLNGVPGIDEGEAYILAKAIEEPGLLVLTGDGRMVRALHQSEATADLCPALEGRIIVFPQVVGALVEHLSVSEVEYRWRSAAPDSTMHRQKSLSVMFGSTSPTRDEDFWSGHSLQVSNVTDSCGDGWLYQP